MRTLSIIPSAVARPCDGLTVAVPVLDERLDRIVKRLHGAERAAPDHLPGDDAVPDLDLVHLIHDAPVGVKWKTTCPRCLASPEHYMHPGRQWPRQIPDRIRARVLALTRTTPPDDCVPITWQPDGRMSNDTACPTDYLCIRVSNLEGGAVANRESCGGGGNGRVSTDHPEVGFLVPLARRRLWSVDSMTSRRVHRR